MSNDVRVVVPESYVKSYLTLEQENKEYEMIFCKDAFRINNERNRQLVDDERTKWTLVGIGVCVIGMICGILLFRYLFS